MKALKIVVVSLLACGLGSAVAAPPVSERGIIPSWHAGNFVSSDSDQVCYDMSALGYIDEFTGEMIGVKVDPPVDYSNAVDTTIHTGGKFLDWTSTGVTLLAFIIKGGPNYHVYDYQGTGYDWDNNLVSPAVRRGNIPQISHYEFCYAPSSDPTGDQGCTPGYWRNHADRWLGAHPSDDFDATFGVDLFSPNVSLGWAIWAGGGGVNALARHATAALLNAYGGVPNADSTTVAYPYTVAQVLQMVQDAVANDTIEQTKNLFEAANELGCPLSGTPAVPAG